MTRSIGCEPLRVWNRVEPRPRRVDFERVLKAEVHDALWMLTRQWQFGEFKGEDTGSAVFAKIALRTSPVDGFQSRLGAPRSYSGAVPLETEVEKLPIEHDPFARARAGQHFLEMLAPGVDAAPPHDLAYYRAIFRNFAQFDPPVLAASSNEPGAVVGDAARRSNPRAHQALLALAGRAIDGWKLFQNLPSGTLTWAALPGSLAIQIPSTHAAGVLQTLKDYRAWFAALYQVPASSSESAWNPSQLEYQARCRIRRSATSAAELVLDEYSTGKLDWYSFNLGERITTPAATTVPTTRVFSVIPTAAQFPGMPSSRFWQFEDGNVDLGNIRADTTDIAKIIVAEFALLYGNNWLVIPCRQPAGTLGEVEGIVVTDVFGEATLIGAATAGSGSSWARWDYFSLSPSTFVSTPATLDHHVFLPPVAATIDESEPLESVSFVRDETTNTVWAVETRLRDGLGVSRDGLEAQRRLRAVLAQREAELASTPATTPPAPAANLHYVLGGTVPDNWIPFVPVHKPGGTRAIRLQRAAMPRFLLDQIRPVRPRTNVLRVGLNDDDTQQTPYFVEEEEVPRAGIVVEESAQRARWSGGRTLVWVGRRKYSGRGEGGSGLRFDRVEPASK